MAYICGFRFSDETRNGERTHLCAASFENYPDYVAHVRRGEHVCTCGTVGVAPDEPEEGPDEDMEAEPETGGIITAEKLHMGILGNWIGWEALEGGDRRTSPVKMVRGGKLESYAIAEMYMSPVVIVVNGVEHRVSPSQHFFWRKA